MDYQTLSPSQCAEEALEQILELICKYCPNNMSGECPDCGGIKSRRREVETLLRQKVRHLVEQCAMEAEDYVATYDLDEHLTGMEVGDAIAERLRQIIDERSRPKRLVTLA